MGGSGRDGASHAVLSGVELDGTEFLLHVGVERLLVLLPHQQVHRDAVVPEEYEPLPQAASAIAPKVVAATR